MTSPLYIAADLGAGSGRVFLAGVDASEFLLIEIHRFQYPPIKEDGCQRWNFAFIFEETKAGFRKAAEKAQELGRSVESIGVDSWGVDYGLLDADGELLSNPVCYRDKRTTNAMQAVFAIVSRWTIFEKTGIQFLDFNTLFQLFSEGGQIDNASQLLLLPDLFNYYLTGKLAAEYTNATTTQMVNTDSGDWDRELLKSLNLPAHIMPGIVASGTVLGKLKPEIAKELELDDVNVIAPASHDTASAIIGCPLDRDQVFISSGTWSLIGIETTEALINLDVIRHNFTNQGGAYGTIGFLKNVMGLWIFESSRKEWAACGIDVGYEKLLDEVAGLQGFQAFIYPDDERFLNPPSMIDAITKQLEETDQKIDESPAMISKIIFDSLAFRYASILRTIESLTSVGLKGIQILGGGGRNRYLNQMTANASGLNVRVGPIEATVIGNILVQAISSGRFGSLAEARQYVRDNVLLDEFPPVHSKELDDVAGRYHEIESRFTNQRP